MNPKIIRQVQKDHTKLKTITSPDDLERMLGSHSVRDKTYCEMRDITDPETKERDRSFEMSRESFKGDDLGVVVVGKVAGTDAEELATRGRRGALSSFSTSVMAFWKGIAANMEGCGACDMRLLYIDVEDCRFGGCLFGSSLFYSLTSL